MIGLPKHMPDIKPMALRRSHKPASDSLPVASMAAARLHPRGGPEQIVYEQVAHLRIPLIADATMFVNTIGGKPA